MDKLTPEHYSAMNMAQDFCCAICKNPNIANRRLGVDHDHKTNEIRGLLCHNCNLGLGYFKDSTELLSRAIKYLQLPPIKWVPVPEPTRHSPEPTSTSMFRCSGCGIVAPRETFHESPCEDRVRPVTSQCRSCRSGAYYARKYPNSTCTSCSQNRRLDKNGVCPRCNEDAGLKQCKRCGDLLPLAWSFYAERKVCKLCLAQQRRVTSREE